MIKKIISKVNCVWRCQNISTIMRKAAILAAFLALNMHKNNEILIGGFYV